MKFIKNSLSLIFTASLITACSADSFQSVASGGNNESSSAEEVPAAPRPPSEFDNLQLKGLVASGSYENENVLSLDKANNALLLFLPMGGIFFNIDSESAKLPGLKIKTILDSKQKARVAISIPLGYVLGKNVSVLPSAKLPSGEDLPMMPAGELPSLGLALNPNKDENVHIYFGVSSVGVYLESKYIPAFLRMTFPVRNSSGTRTIGYFTLLPKSGSHDGGIFLSIILPNDISRIIDDHLNGIVK